MGLNELIKASKRQLLVTPVHEQWLMSNPDVELSETVAQWVAKELVAKQRDRTRSWSASSLGGCQRKHIYTYLGVPRERGVSAATAAIFQHGTWTHLKWQSQGYMAGWLGQVEIPCELPEYNGKGTVDGALAQHEAGWELKSINARGYRFVLADGPKHEHLMQIHFYMLATGWRLWSLIYEEKDTQNYQEFVVPFDQNVALQVELELAALSEAVKTKTLPPMLPGCVKKSTAEYRQCPFRERCEASQWPQRLVIKTS
jgi:hypothetical protein